MLDKLIHPKGMCLACLLTLFYIVLWFLPATSVVEAEHWVGKCVSTITYEPNDFWSTIEGFRANTE